jgi:hypothetical protein
MATQSRSKASSKNGSKAAAAPEKNQAQVLAEAALDLPVGAVLTVTDRVGDLVEPFTTRTSAERKIKAYRSELRRTLKRTERRGTSARRRATNEAKKTRNRVEREARRRQRKVETTLKRNRTRAQELVEQIGDQIPSIR